MTFKDIVIKYCKLVGHFVVTCLSEPFKVADHKIGVPD